MNNSTQRYAKCPYCAKKFWAGRSANSNLNRHLKQMAQKTDNKRGAHPAFGTAAYEQLYAERTCRERASTEAERKEKESRRKRKWKIKQCQARHADQSADLTSEKMELGESEETELGDSEASRPVLSIREGLERLLGRLR